MTGIAGFAASHIDAFNHAVAAADFGDFLTRFSDAAVLRFENVPGAGNLESSGRSAYTAAYAEQPPDDQIDIAGSVVEDGAVLVIPFAWRRDGSRGTMRLTTASGLIERMAVRFD